MREVPFERRRKFGSSVNRTTALRYRRRNRNRDGNSKICLRPGACQDETPRVGRPDICSVCLADMTIQLLSPISRLGMRGAVRK